MTGKRSSLLRWTVACLVVMSGHAAVVWAAIAWKPESAAAPAAPPAIFIDLTEAAPQKPPLDVAPGPETEQSDVAEPEPEPPPVEEAKVEPPPEPPRPKEAEVVLPEPKPPEPKKREQKKQKAQVAKMTPTFQAQQADRATAPSQGAATGRDVPRTTWQSDLLAALNRHKRYPPGAAGTGTAIISFSINGSGQVTTARLVKSSGDNALDQEAVALPRRASPLPAPPTGIRGPVALTVPVRFSR